MNKRLQQEFDTLILDTWLWLQTADDATDEDAVKQVKIWHQYLVLGRDLPKAQA